MHAFIVGCQRGGTTYLAEMLDQHPQIRMVRPLEPEPKFFLSLENCTRGPAHYHQLYGPPGDRAVVCEKTTSYMEYDEIPGRIRSCFPDARILIMLRNPVERAISHYFYSVQNGLERRPVEEGLFGPEPATRPANLSMSPFRYVPRSRYVRSVSNYLSSFPDANVLVTESIVGNPDGIRKVYEYLGVDAAFVPGNPSQKVNAGPPTPAVSEAIRRRLAELLMPQVDELEKLVSADLRSWWAFTSPSRQGTTSALAPRGPALGQ